MKKETTFTIEILEHDLNSQIEQSVIDGAIVAEKSGELCVRSRIYLSGKYNRYYDVVSHFIQMSEHRVLIDGDTLLICLYSELAIVDLSQNKLIRTLKFNCYEIFGIYKFKSGYFLRGEMFNYFLDKGFYMVWEKGAIDIFVNPLVDKEFEIFDDYITAFDWYGGKHYYNESGEYKTEYYTEYIVSKSSN